MFAGGITVPAALDVDTTAAVGQTKTAVAAIGRQSATVEVGVSKRSQKSLADSLVSVHALGKALRGLAVPGALVAATPAVASLGASAVTAAGSLWLLPAAGMAAGASIAALSTGLKGFGDAMGELDDPEKFAEALKKLSPAARETARTVKNELAPAWKTMQLDVQDRLFRRMSATISQLSGAYLPILRTQFTQLAGSYNVAARGAARVLLSKQSLYDTSSGMMNLNAATASAARASGPLVQALRDIGVVGSTFLPGAGDAVYTLAVRFRNFIAEARQSGQLRQWIQNGLDVLGQLGQLARNVGSILGSIFGAASRSGQSFLATLVGITGRLAAALQTPAVAAGLQTFFARVRQLVASFTDKLVALWPAIQAAAGAFFDIMVALSPFVTALATLASVILPPVLGLLGGLAPILVPVALAFGAIVTAMKLYTLWQGLAAIATGKTTLSIWGMNAAFLANPITWIILAITALVAAVVYAWNNFQWFRSAVTAVWTGIQTVISFVWHTILKPIFTAIWAAVQAVGRVFRWLWTTIIQPIFTVIGTVARVLFSILVAAVLLPIIGAARLLGTVFRWVWTTILRPVFQGIAAVAGWMWRTILRPAFTGITAAFRAVGAAIGWVWRTLIKPVWDGLGSVVRWVWRTVLKPVFGFIGDTVKTIGRGFEKFGEIVKTVFDAIVGFVKKPIQVVIDIIWNNSLRWLFEKASKIPVVGGAVPDFLTKRITLARGGVVPGYAPGRDTVPAMVSPGEAWLVPELTRLIGKQRIEAANTAAMRSRGTGGAAPGAADPAVGQVLQFFAGGGVVGRVKPAGAARRAGAMGATGAAEVTGAAADAAVLDTTAAGLSGTMDTLTAATTAYQTSVTGLATTALAPLQQQITTKTVPAMTRTATLVGTRNVAAAVKLRTTLPTLAAQQTRTSATTRTAWTATTNRVVASQNTMQRRQTQLASGMRVSWNSIAGWTQNSVTRQQRSYTGLQNGMARVRTAMSNTAAWAGRQFNRMYQAAANPVRRMITGPFNRGLIKAWNRLAGDFNMKPKVAWITPGFAAGGDLSGPGTGTSDSFLIRASDGEFMVRESIARRTRPFLRALNDGQAEAVQAAGGWRARGPKGYARGGPVADTGSAYNAALLRGIKVARSMHRKPYIWGGASRAGADCSGYMSIIHGALAGENPYVRRYSTASFSGGATAGFVRGLKSGFAIGVSPGSHMAGTLAGTNVESGGSHGYVSYGGPAAGADDGQFSGRYSLPFVGGRFRSGGGGGGIDPQAVVNQAFTAVPGMIRALLAAFPGNRAAKTSGAESEMALRKVKAFALKKVSAIAAMTGAAGTAGSPAVKNAVRAVARQFGWGSGAQWSALDWLISQESSWNPRAANPTSSARGLFQKMTSIHGPVESTVAGQARWGLNYIRGNGNFSDPIGAKRFHMANNWYDRGGLATGTGLMFKNVIAPERVLNPANSKSFDTLAYMLRTGRLALSFGDDGTDTAGGGGPLIGRYEQHFHGGTANAGFDELEHRLTVARRGGRYR